MKTPREILIERHRDAELKLDAIRQKALEGLERRSADDCSRRRQEADHHGGSPIRLLNSAAARLLGSSVVRSWRWHIAGLSAAWLAIALLNVDRTPTPSPTIAKQNIPSAHQLLTAMRENRRQLLEIMALPAGEQPVTPSRRSESKVGIALA